MNVLIQDLLTSFHCGRDGLVTGASVPVVLIKDTCTCILLCSYCYSDVHCTLCLFAAFFQLCYSSEHLVTLFVLLVMICIEILLDSVVILYFNFSSSALLALLVALGWRTRPCSLGTHSLYFLFSNSKSSTGFLRFSTNSMLKETDSISFSAMRIVFCWLHRFWE